MLRFQPRKFARLPRVPLWLHMLLIYGAGFALPAMAEPSCNLESWLRALNRNANTYVAALGTPHEHDAARQFRTEMERYARGPLLQQIDAAELGNNKQALLDFISSRRHLLELQRANWPEMAERYGADPRFGAQSESLQNFFARTPCDPDATDFLNGEGEQEQSLIERVNSGIEEIADIVTSVTSKEEQPPAPVDPDNFDEFRPSLSAKPPKKPMPVTLSPSGNVAFVLGLFTFITAISFWIWMRYGIMQRRAARYPCALPTIVFDGIQPVLGEMLDLSQVGAKLDIDMELRLKQKVKITCGSVTRKARVIWRNSHFAGVRFERALTEAEMRSLLETYAAEVATARQEARDFGLELSPKIDGLPASPSRKDADGTETPEEPNPMAMERAETEPSEPHASPAEETELHDKDPHEILDEMLQELREKDT